MPASNARVQANSNQSGDFESWIKARALRKAAAASAVRPSRWSAIPSPRKVPAALSAGNKARVPTSAGTNDADLTATRRACTRVGSLLLPRQWGNGRVLGPLGPPLLCLLRLVRRGVQLDEPV